MPMVTSSTVAEAPMLPYTPTQQFYYPHLHPMFDPSLYDLFYDFCFYVSEQINKLIYDDPPEAVAISSLSSVCSNNICLYFAAISSALLKTF